MIELLGWSSQLLFMICGAPQAYVSWRQGHSTGVSGPFLFLWYIAELLSIVYGFAIDVSLQILVNYFVNAGFISIIIFYKLFPRR